MRTQIALALVLLATVTAPARAQEALQPGMKAPAVQVETLDGRSIATTGHGGARAVLIVFWATWSSTSPEVLERVERVASALGPKGLVTLAINVEASRIDGAAHLAVRSLVERLRLTVPVGIDRGLEAFHAFGIVAVPTLVLTRGDGTVLATLASFPIMGREEFFELTEATVTGRGRAAASAPEGVAPAPRAVRLFNLARTMAARGLVDDALVNLRMAVEADPGFVLARVLLGQLARERATAHHGVRGYGKSAETLHMVDTERARLLQEAEGTLMEALRVAPRSAPALTELALVYRDRGDAERARELAVRAVGADAAYAPARATLGTLLLATGDVARGRAELDAALQLNPLDGRLHVAAAEAYETRGMHAEAVAAFRRGVELLWQARRQAGP